MKIQKEETQIIGSWRFDGKKMLKDANCERIELLTSSYLREIAADESGWDVLFQDPLDGRYWELLYPQSEMHGGGHPALFHISVNDAKAKYKF